MAIQEATKNLIRFGMMNQKTFSRSYLMARQYGTGVEVPTSTNVWYISDWAKEELLKETGPVYVVYSYGVPLAWVNQQTGEWKLAEDWNTVSIVERKNYSKYVALHVAYIRQVLEQDLGYKAPVTEQAEEASEQAETQEEAPVKETSAARRKRDAAERRAAQAAAKETARA